MNQINFEYEHGQPFNELKGKMSAEAKEQMDAKVKVMVTELDCLLEDRSEHWE